MPLKTARAARGRGPAGTTLIELLVALPLAAVLGAVAVAVLLDTHRLARRLGSTTEMSRELRQAAAVLEAETRPLSAADVIAWTDTSLEIRALTASGTVCASSGNTVDLLPLAGTDALRTAWAALPEAGDDVWTVAPDSALMPERPRWTTTPLQTVATPAASPCGTLPLLGGSSARTASPIRLALAATAHPTPAPGTPVRITRRTRYSLYRAGDGLWYLGQKSLANTGWTTVQPVAGPLLSPPDEGLVVEPRDSAGNSLPAGAPVRPRSVGFRLRAASPWLLGRSAGVIDSLTVHVTLRGESSSRTAAAVP